jgi:GNAT superfamily N-acetyltransferase
MFAHEIGVDARIRHVTLRWDGITGAIEQSTVGALAAAGFAIEHTWVMTATEVTARPATSDALEIRPLERAEMAAVAALDLMLAERHDEPFRQFLHRRAIAKQRLVERNLARWWGAFDRTLPPRDALVGSLGLVPLANVARYQDVQTATSHRRRGIASGLLAAAARDHTTLVIVAEPDSAAARVYGRAGFAVAERIASACRYPRS